MKYFVTEKCPKSPGHEYQMIDDTGYPGKLTPLQVDRHFYHVMPATADKPLHHRAGE